MKNNELGKVAFNAPSTKRNRFNLSHDVCTTSGFGVLQPLACHWMIPDTKVTLDIESLVRFAPMVAPAFTRSKLKTWSMFIPLEEIFPNYPFLIGNQAVARSGSTFIPQRIPSISVSQLSLLCLIGSQCTVWRKNKTGNTFHWHRYKDVSSSEASGLIGFVGGPFQDSEVLSSFDYTGPTLNLSFIQFLLGSTVNWSQYSVKVPYGLSKSATVTGTVGDIDTMSSTDVTVPLDAADCVVWTRTLETAGNPETDGRELAFAFRFSSFGQRMYKLLTGLGYPFSLTTSREVSLLPLFAWYRGYFELFGIEMYKSFEQTSCFKLIQRITQNNSITVDHGVTGSLWDDTSSDLWQFFREVSDCFVTDVPDYVSSHIPKPGINENVPFDLEEIGNHFIDVVNAGTQGSAFNYNRLGDEQRQLYITRIEHGELDSKWLKIAYRWCNKYSVFGQNLEDILRAIGQGKFVDEVKVSFIGYSEKMLNVSDVTATSDTTSDVSGKGSLLGEIAGKSVTYDKNESVSFESKSAGYWITYVAIVPESGYSQGFDHTVTCLDRESIYNKELDGLGYEATPKSELLGYGTIAKYGDSDSNFGFIPRHSGWKIKNNKFNGGFKLGSVRSSFLPYSLDKVIPINEGNAVVLSDTTSDTTVYFNRIMNFSNTPIAGSIWRYNFKYGWNGNLNRIFANDSDTKLNSYNLRLSNDTLGLDGNTRYEYCHLDDDNILMQFIMNMQEYSPKKPIGESFETYDETAPANASASHA